MGNINEGVKVVIEDQIEMRNKVQAAVTDLSQTLQSFLKDTEELDAVIGNKLAHTRNLISEIQKQVETSLDEVNAALKRAEDFVAEANELMN